MKIAQSLHVSKTTAKEEVLSFIKIILEKDKTNSISSSLELDQTEVDYIIKMNKL